MSKPDPPDVSQQTKALFVLVDKLKAKEITEVEAVMAAYSIGHDDAMAACLAKFTAAIAMGKKP